MADLLKSVPKAFLDDFVNNNVIPIVGAGFSRNAFAPPGVSIPAWRELGVLLANDYGLHNQEDPIEVFSEFESKYSRVRLVETLRSILQIDKIQPGLAHRNFSKLQFETICTTNWDSLLEQTYQVFQKPYMVVLTDGSLAIANKDTKIVKLHGDFSIPQNMIISENDYDTYLENHKLFSTYLSSLFITKTPFFLGYSLDDPDIRSLWQIVNSRLGQLQRPAYTIAVNASESDIMRYERRKVKLINLKGARKNYSSILADFFEQLKAYIDNNINRNTLTTNQEASDIIKFSVSQNNLCYLSSQPENLPLIKQVFSPLLIDRNFVPITVEEVINENLNDMQKREYLLLNAAIALIDLTEDMSRVLWEINFATSKNIPYILITNSNDGSLMRLANAEVIIYNYFGIVDNHKEIFLRKLTAASINTQKDIIEGFEDKKIKTKGNFRYVVINEFNRIERKLPSIRILLNYRNINKLEFPEDINNCIKELQLTKNLIRFSRDKVFSSNEVENIKACMEKLEIYIKNHPALLDKAVYKT